MAQSTYTPTRPGTREIYDYSSPSQFHLPHAKPKKTIDIARDGILVSADPFGRILQLSAYHSEHGIVVAAPFAQFDGTRFRDPEYVRSYRRLPLDFIRDGKPGMGLVVVDPDCNVSFLEIEVPNHYSARSGYRLGESILVNCILEVRDYAVYQHLTIHNSGLESYSAELALQVCASVHRASYGQLTEGGPIPLPECHNVLRESGDGNCITVANDAVGARLQVCVEAGGEMVNVGSYELQDRRDQPVEVNKHFHISVPARSEVSVAAHFQLISDGGRNGPYIQQIWTQKAVARSLNLDEHWLCIKEGWLEPKSIKTYIIRRNLDYILGNCCVPVSETEEVNEVAVLADHVALPLGWNRDNYWQIHFLLNVAKHVDLLRSDEAARAGELRVHESDRRQRYTNEDYRDAIHTTARSHLSWVFGRAQRPHGFWHRSYLVNGRPKDAPLFQLDQQCYPLLELCEYRDAYPVETEFVCDLITGTTTATGLDLAVPAVSSPVEQVLAAIAARADLGGKGTGLVPTDESPGDDPLDYPFSFSNHVLLWHTLYSISGLVSCLPGLETGLRNRILAQSFALISSSEQPQHFLTTDGERPMLCYVTDGRGAHTLYHDANDVPTVFFPQWARSDETHDKLSTAWRNTMTFAFSPRNSRGYAAGPRSAEQGPDVDDLPPFAGLGSVHSPGAWPLGYSQELRYALHTEDAGAAGRAWRRIQGAMQWDGTFCEAVDVATGECTSKAWFGWPGAMIADLLVDIKTGKLPDLLD